MPATEAVFAATSAANSVAAQAAAHRAMIERCKAEIAGYYPQNATVAEMQSYAECVQAVYPRELAGPELILAKAAVALALIGAPLGIWKTREFLCDDVMGWLLGALMGAILLPAIAACIGAAGLGLVWLFQ